MYYLHTLFFEYDRLDIRPDPTSILVYLSGTMTGFYININHL